MTFSIIGIDRKREEMGIATSTKAIACGAIVPHAKAGVGAIATQAYPNVFYKEKGISLLEKDKPSEKVIKSLVREDKKKNKRQVVIMDSKGNSSGFTGEGNIGFADHFAGKDFICAGNMLSGKEVLGAISNSFSKSKGKLADRLIKALIAGEKAGGDKRNKVYGSSSLLVVKKNHGPLGIGDRYIDLRIDHSKQPINNLKELLKERKKNEDFFSNRFRY